MRCGGTRTAASPASNTSISSLRVRWRQSSMAKMRCGQRAAQAMAAKWPSGVAGTVFSASLRPVSPTATRVWLRLCASMPITIVPSASFPPSTNAKAERGHALFRGLRPGSYQATPNSLGALDERHKEEKPQPGAGQRRNEPTRQAWKESLHKSEESRRLLEDVALLAQKGVLLAQVVEFLALVRGEARPLRRSRPGEPRHAACRGRFPAAPRSDESLSG